MGEKFGNVALWLCVLPLCKLISVFYLFWIKFDSTSSEENPIFFFGRIIWLDLYHNVLMTEKWIFI